MKLLLCNLCEVLWRGELYLDYSFNSRYRWGYYRSKISDCFIDILEIILVYFLVDDLSALIKLGVPKIRKSNPQYNN